MYATNPYEAQCGRAYPRGHRLTAADRQDLPDEAFGLIRGPGHGRGGRQYPMPDAVHAANAKARASAAYEKGYLSRREYNKIVRHADADAILERCEGILAPVVPLPRRRRVAANPRISDREALDTIQDLLVGESWDGDTCVEVATILRLAGRETA